MATRLLSHCLPFPKVFLKRFSNIKSYINLGTEMKLLNDKKQFKKALALFDQHGINNILTLSNFTITQVLKACAHKGDLQRGKIIHNLIASKTKNDIYVSSTLIHLYVLCDDIASAQSLFDSTKNKTPAMYGIMMKAFIKNKQANKAIALFNEIQNPNDVHMILLFNSCAQLKTKEALDLVKKISNQIPKSFYSNPHLLTSLLDALMKCGDVAHAESSFYSSKQKVISSYGAMMKGYVDNNLPEKAIDLFNKIQNPNDVHMILLFNSCAQLKTKEALDLVKRISKQIPKSFYSNPRLLTSLLDSLMKCGDVAHAESLFYGSKEKVLPMYGAMMKGDYSKAQSIVKQVPDCLLVENQIPSALIDLWGKVGSIDEAKLIFDKIRQPNTIEYTTMVNSYGLNGMGMQAIALFHQIPRELLGEATYVCALNACSHSGLVGEARLIFKNIEMKTMRIYSTMIDCLSRASAFDQAQELIDEYERNHSPESTMYMALLSGARNAKNVHLSQNIYDRMKKLFPERKDPLVSAAVLLANVYASSGEIDKASDIRSEIYKSGTKKKVGLTWITVDGQVYTFRAHDRSHPRSNEIYAEGEKISNEIIKYGHQYDSSWITRVLDEDETVESVLCGHSERLAIAWGFVANPNASKLQMVKNLRICDRSTKLIAAIRQCEMIVRDANRIHHFYKNGQCSCNDYF
ncbi:unnamed protein product [Rotaria magnacalcarata]|uniref:DYW domain-containing protein n=1 Tax=Rotaria magnacalcarata TaxID=392030 RepID=A0A815FA12_9BILA|nr:unnamed protein product [Rotaria magnacalcarata]